uniref:Uncharacterized protein n=1 Tax=Podoviridae sp. ct9A73 TaxID=2825225 RepID=A0A8S5UJW8_9CAUD|nr:MAG TPA: hypothetical protein [Podoviridae sp. ct9A73]
MTRNDHGYSNYDYGVKVLDPVTKYEIFNAKYPIFGSDITNKVPQIVTRRVVITNSSHIFNEPNHPNLNFNYSGEWTNVPIVQFQDVDILKVPHGQGKVPIFMSMARSHLVNRMYARWFQADGNFTVEYNMLVTPAAPGSGYYSEDVPFMPTQGRALIDPISGKAFDFVVPLGNGNTRNITNNFVRWKNLRIFADNENIYARMSLGSLVSHRSSRWGPGASAVHQFIKLWTDLSGSWFDFTFYIFPYDPKDDIFVR